MAGRKPLSLKDIMREVEAIREESDPGRVNGRKLRLYRRVIDDIANASTLYQRIKMIENAGAALHAEEVPGLQGVAVASNETTRREVTARIGPEATRIMEGSHGRPTD